MRGYLIDTNVLSEIRKGPARAKPEVHEWWESIRDANIYLSVLTIGEIRKGIARLAERDASQARILETWLDGLKESFLDQMIPISPAIAETWGRLQAIRPLPEIDALLAATALQGNLILVTRNEADFQGLGLTVLNPFLSLPESPDPS